MAAATEIEKKRAAAAEEQVRILAEINDRLIRIEARLEALLAPQHTLVTASKGRSVPQS
jgi:hypothetical protein